MDIPLIRKITLFFICITSFIVANAQNNIVVAGNTALGSGGTSTYSVGQMVYTQQIGSNVTSIQGVQQPYEISILLSTPNFSALTVKVYPNPSTEVLHLISPNDYNLEGMYYELFDINGKEIKPKTALKQNDEIIQMDNLPIGYYIVTVSQDKSIVKSFKILKK